MNLQMAMAAALAACGISVSVTTHGSVLDVRSMGAVGDGVQLNTRAIQRAIDACPAGGTVHIPKGEFLTGALTLKSDMALELADGAVLKGSANASDYPVSDWWFEGRAPGPCYASLLSTPASGVSNLVIRGKGVVDGNGSDLLVAEERVEKKGKRGRLLAIANSRNVRLEGVMFRHSPCWCLHLYGCDDVVIDGVTVRTLEDERGSRYRYIHNGDGIDLDSCRRVVVKGCRIFSQDDCIAVKSGRGEWGRRTARPSEDIEVFNTHFGSGLAMAVGSEMSGGVKRLHVHDCTFTNVRSIVNVKTCRGRGGVLEDMTFERLRGTTAGSGWRRRKAHNGALQVSFFYYDESDVSVACPIDEGTPRISNVVFRDIECEDPYGWAICVLGLPEAPIEGLTFERVMARGLMGMRAVNLRNLVMRDCLVESHQGKRYVLENVTWSSKVEKPGLE